MVENEQRRIDKKDRDDAILFYEFKYKSIMDIVNVMVKVFSFYIIIIGAVLGFIFTKDVNQKELVNLLYAICGISGIFSIILLAVIWGVGTGLRDIKDTLNKINDELFMEIGLNKYFKRGILVSIIVGICGVVIVIIFLTLIYVFLSSNA